MLIHPTPGKQTVAPPQMPHYRQRAVTLVATSLGFEVVQLDVNIVKVALRHIGATFGKGVSDLWLQADGEGAQLEDGAGVAVGYLPPVERRPAR